MRCPSCDNYDLLVSWIALFVGFFATLLAYYGIKYQIISLIHSQLSEKARETNAYLDSNSKLPKEPEKISCIVSTIITAKQILNYQWEKYWFLNILTYRKQAFIDVFHLQLHVSIRNYFEKYKESSYEKINPIVDSQIRECYKFLKEAIKKWDREKTDKK